MEQLSKAPPRRFGHGPRARPRSVNSHTRLGHILMRFRHAAALALVAWYLLCPPMRFDHPENPFDLPRIFLNATLAEWDIQGSYDSAQECESGKVEFQAQGRSWTIPDLAAAQRLNMAVCIATDDPRLKGN